MAAVVGVMRVVATVVAELEAARLVVVAVVALGRLPVQVAETCWVLGCRSPLSLEAAAMGVVIGKELVPGVAFATQAAATLVVP